MKIKQWFAISKKGITKVRKTKPDLDWSEIAVQISLEIPDELFKRPVIDAKLEIKDIPNNAYDVDVILNTKELIEQQTGAKINFTIVREEDKSNHTQVGEKSLETSN